MKPQSLQDAIKARALKKEQTRQAVGWKEPYVKKYEITAADLVKSPAATAPASYASSPSSSSAQAAMLPNGEVLAIKSMVEWMQVELKQQRMDITALQKENKELREQVEKLEQQQGEHAQALASGSSRSTIESSPSTTAPSSAPAIVDPSSPKKAKVPASVEPHTVEDLAECQRLDKAMRQYLRTQEGLYDGKYMTIREEKDGRLICFKNKIYIPLKLRDKTIEHYKRQHETESIALAAMRKNCCWPDLEKDFFEHKL